MLKYIVLFAVFYFVAAKRPCRIVDEEGNPVTGGRSRLQDCKRDEQCTVGPFTKTNRRGENKVFYICNPTAERALIMLEGACKTVTAGVEALSEDNACDNPEDCNIGPFSVEKDGEEVQFFKCTGSKPKRKGSCKVLDSEGNVVSQRECSEGPDKCNVGPVESTKRGVTTQKFYCEGTEPRNNRENKKGGRRGGRRGRKNKEQ